MCRLLVLLALLSLAPILCAQQVFIGSPDQVPANSPAVGQLDYIAFGFGAQKAASAAATVTLMSVTVGNLGTALTSDWVRIRLIKDSNTNATVDAGDIVLSSVQSTSFPVVFPPLPPGDTIPFGPAASIYLVAVDIAPGAVVGRTFQLRIAANTDFVVNPAQTVAGAPLTGNTQTIAAATTAEMDIQRVTAPPTSIAAGATDNIGNRIAGTPFALTYTVLNTGAQSLTLQGVPQVFIPTFAVINCVPSVTAPPVSPVPPMGQTTFTLQVNVTATGPFGFIARLDNNDANENSYAFVITGTGVLPAEMDVLRGAVPVADGGADTVTGAIAGTPSVLTYTINNTGTGPLTLTVPVAVPGAQTNCVATITTQPSGTVNAAGTTSLVISVTPAAAGAFSFMVSIANDDANENPYNWAVSGTAAGPEIDVFRAATATAVLSGSNDARGTLMGGMSHALNYDIKNTGQAVLNLPSGVSITAQNNCVTTSGALATTVAAAGMTGLTLNVTPGANGPFSFNVSIANNDANENPYTWTVSGTSFVPAPEMELLRGTTPIADGAFDNIGVVASLSPLNVTYTIENIGTAPLNLTNAPAPVIVLPGLIASATVTTQPSNVIAASGATTFTLSCTVFSPGAFSFEIRIDSDDADEGFYNLTITGTGVPGVPEIDVVRAALPVADGGTEALGSAPAGVVITLHYTISNVGAGLLILNVPVTITGNTNCTVNVTVQPGAVVAASGGTSMSIDVTLMAAGAFSFNVSIANDDPNENPYDWTVSGTAAAPPPAGSGGGGSCSAEITGLAAWPLIAIAGPRARRRRS